MPFLDRYTEERKTGGFLDRYTEGVAVTEKPEEERPKWWQKELRTAKELVKFPYTITKEITYPMAKGLAKFPFAPKEAEAEIRETGEKGVAMGKEFGGGVLDWILASTMKETSAGIMAQQRIGERLKEHGVLAEAIYPLALMGVVGKGIKVTGKPRGPQILAKRLAQIEEIGKPKVPTVAERLAGIREMEIPPKAPDIPFPGLKEKVVPSEKPIPKTVLEEILGLEKKKPKAKGVAEKPAEIPSFNDIKDARTKINLGGGDVTILDSWVAAEGGEFVRLELPSRRNITMEYDVLVGKKAPTGVAELSNLKDITQGEGRLEVTDIGIHRPTLGKMVEGFRQRSSSVMERPIAMVLDKKGKLKVLEGEHRFAAAKIAGVEPPMVLLTTKQTANLNALQIDALARKVYTGKNTYQLTDFYNKAKGVAEKPAEIPRISEIRTKELKHHEELVAQAVKNKPDITFPELQQVTKLEPVQIDGAVRRLEREGTLIKKEGKMAPSGLTPSSYRLKAKPAPAVKPTPKVVEPTKPKIAEEFLTNAEKKARERIRKRGIRLTTGIDPAEMADYTIIGAAKIGKGAIKFADWSVEMVREFGDRIKPYLKTIYARSQQELPKFKANAELDSFLDYFEDIQAPVEFRPPRKPARTAIRERLREEGLTGKELTLEANAEFIKATQDYGIALHKTKAGKVQPSIRVAGTYVPEDFATYTEFKDAKAGVFGGTKDATRFIQEIDGALSVEAKAKLPGQAGPAERYVLHRTRDIVKFKLNWTNAMKSRLGTISKGLSKEQLKIANQVIEHISREGAYIDPAKLVTNPKISKLTTDLNVVRFAQEARQLYESLLRHQNEARQLRGQKRIPHRDYYTAHSIHETTIWERALGHNKTPEQVIGPGLPDYIKPNAPFNPRAMARELGLPETIREMNLRVILERYIETAAKDVFNTSIVQNNKAFIQQLKSLGYEHAARGLENWTAEAFTGVRAAVDRVANLSPTIHKGMNRFRRGLIRSVFPLNLAWNTFVQTSSTLLGVTRYGYRNSVGGMYDWFSSKKIRQEIRDNAYSAIIKSQRSGRISRQDINRGVGAAERLNRGKLEKASDAANFFTDWLERHLTGSSVATAKRHGVSVGLKGKALWEYASDGGAKVQSMYNLEDLPGMLRSEVVKTGAPFQTFSFEVFNTLREFAGKTGTPPATAAIRIKMVLRFLAGATAINYIGQAAIGRKPWELSSFIPFYGAVIAPVSAALRGEDVSMTTTRGLPAPVGIAIKGGQAVHKGLLRPGFAATKELARTRNFKAALKEFMATGKWVKLRRFTIRYLSGFVGVPGGTQMNRIVDGLIAVSAGGMIDSADRMMFPITDTKDKMRSFLAGPWATKGGQDYWDKRGGELNLDIEFFEENPLLRDMAESVPVFGDFFKFKKDSKSQTQQAVGRMIRTGNIESARGKRLEWNMENPDNKISWEWYSKQLREATP